MKVLICEDADVLITALEYRLRKQGFEIFLVRKGERVVSTILSAKPDLIVADIGLPQMGGLEILHYIRHTMVSDMPIILTAPLENDDLILEGFRLGANDFISKPFKPNELILRIKCIMQSMGMTV